jgi:hypothetical protein
MSARSTKGVLQEHMIYQRTRTLKFADVHALNMWGCELEDVSIIAQLTNVQTLALPVNKITTLAPFGHCRKLQNLLLRENQIASLDELDNLRNLPNLVTLSLIDNPVAELPNYRESAIRMLPHLEKLDEVPVARPRISPGASGEHASIPSKAQPLKKSEFPPVESRIARPQNLARKTTRDDSNMLSAVLALIPELSRDSLRVVLEAIEKRCRG